MSAVMNQVSDVVDITPKNQPAALVVMSPGQLVSQLMQQGGSVDLSAMERLMGLQERWDANEAKKAYHQSMAAFKQNPPTIYKDRHVDFTTQKGRTAYDHASIGNVVKQIVAALAESNPDALIPGIRISPSHDSPANRCPGFLPSYEYLEQLERDDAAAVASYREDVQRMREMGRGTR